MTYKPPILIDQAYSIRNTKSCICGIVFLVSGQALFSRRLNGVARLIFTNPQNQAELAQYQQLRRKIQAIGSEDLMPYVALIEQFSKLLNPE